MRRPPAGPTGELIIQQMRNVRRGPCQMHDQASTEAIEADTASSPRRQSKSACSTSTADRWPERRSTNLEGHPGGGLPGESGRRDSVVPVIVLARVENYEPSHVLAAFDHGGQTWRHRGFASYHAGRETMPASMRESLLAHVDAVRLSRELVGFKTDMKLGLSWSAIRFEPTGAAPIWEPSPSI